MSEWRKYILLKKADLDYVLKIIFIYFLAYLIWLIYGIVYYRLQIFDTTDIFVKLPLNDYRTAYSLYTLFKGSSLLTSILGILYSYAYVFIMVCVPVYLLLKRKLDIALHLAIAELIALIIALISFTFIGTLPPRIVYNLDLVSPEIVRLSNPYFVFPSLHATYPFLQYLILRYYRENSLLKGIVLSISIIIPIIIVLLLMHWIYDAVAGIILAYLSFKISNKIYHYVKSLVNSINVSKSQLIVIDVTLIFVSILISLLKILGVF